MVPTPITKQMDIDDGLFEKSAEARLSPTE
jgi:hypothetical protein